MWNTALSAERICRPTASCPRGMKSTTALRGLYSLTLHEDTYILLCAGAKPTGGYRVKIEKAVETSPNNLVITATLTKPGPQDMVTMAITYPNALLRFSGRRFNTANSSLVK